MRASAPGQSALLMADVAGILASRGVRYAVIGAMAAAVHGVVHASLDAEAVLDIVGREDFIAMKAFAGDPVDRADARAVIELDRESLDLELLRRLAQRFGRDAARVLDEIIGDAD
jgi:hypothetical protein